MDRTSIDLKTISCKGVKSFNPFQKPCIYAAVSVGSGSEKKRQQQKTPIDRSGGKNPEWDHPMRFDLDGGIQDLLLDFDLVAQGNILLLGDKVVGKARVPVADLAAENFAGDVRQASYQIRTPDGKPNGILYFSYKINYPEIRIPAPGPAISLPASAPPAVDYYPPLNSPNPSTSLPAPAAAVDYYPSPPAPAYYPSPSPAAPAYYPSQSPATGLYPRLDTGDCCPAPAPAVGYFPMPVDPSSYPTQTPPVGGYYPPPPPVHGAYVPPPTSMNYYPPPPNQYGCQPESCDRGLYGYS